MSFSFDTARLTFRPYQPDDLPAMAAMHARDEVARYLPWDALDHDRAVARLEKYAAVAPLEKPDDRVIVPAFEKDGGRYVGEYMLRIGEVETNGEVGYILDPSMAGRGYATEGALAFLRMGFDDLGLHRIMGRIDARNDASARVLEKCGMRREAFFRENWFLKGEWTDEIVYAILDEEWQARQKG